MKASDIRQTFIEFFQNQGHQVVPSESLMPSSPNLLFTNAGMNQFVPYFLGDRPAPFKRAVDTQKCIRAGGKHNDLDDVGFDTYHHTFFEMLGNWSFGDYFKEEAIQWAWELLTKVWKFPKERLYVTVYKPAEGDPAEFDQEAYDFWKAILEKEGMDPSVHIVYGNKEDNFWMMGDTGPCGPSSEVHMDLTPNGDTRGSLVNKDSGLCIEIWNLVFIQFNAEPDGTFLPLKAQHVDTGMGLERVAGIVETTKNFTDYSDIPSNYNSDLFTPIFEKIAELSGKEYQFTLPESREGMSEQELTDCVFRILGDHIRTLSFSIADGILPGNEGRNYVLRRILRRAVMYGHRIGLSHGFFVKLVEPLVETMGTVFPELKENRTLIEKVIGNEEAAFERTLDRGLQLLEKITANKSQVSGKEAFELYDTYGFPLDLTEVIGQEKGFEVDKEGFEQEMEGQRQRARAAQKKTIIRVSEDDEGAATEFVGYDWDNLNDFQSTVTAVGDNYIILEKSPFYAEMGGQIGDSGMITIGSESFAVSNTTKDEKGHFLHIVSPTPSANMIGQTATASVSPERRKAIERNHTATHLLHYALRKVLGSHVKQAGSLVAPSHLRFDFSHYEGVTKEQLQEIESIVNQSILQNHSVKSYETTFDNKPENCIAFFGEKYGSVVRVVDIGNYSVELCGGTHVGWTGEIGLCKITSESAISAGTRRIEAVVGEEAYNLVSNESQQLHSLAQALSCKTTEINSRLEQLLSQKHNLEKELRKFQQQSASAQGKDLVSKASNIDDIQWVISDVTVGAPNDLRGLAVSVSKELGPSAILLAAPFGEKVNIVALCSQEAIDKGISAGNLVKDLATQLGGKGGGKPDYAMGGAKNSGNLAEVMSKFTHHLQEL